MKKIILLVLPFCLATAARSQSSHLKRVFDQYYSAKTIEDKSDILNAYFEGLAKGPFAGRIASAIEMQDYFISKSDAWGTGFIQLAIAVGYRVTAQYDSALKFSLPALKNFEDINDTSAMISALLQIGSSFTESQNIQQGLNYYKKCKTFIEGKTDDEKYGAVLNKIADCYNKLNLPDSAMPPIQRAIKIAEEQKDSSALVDYCYIIGESYLARNEPETARFYFWKSVDYAGARTVYNVNSHTTKEYYANLNCDFAESFFKSASYDSAIVYAQQAVDYASPEYKKHLMIAYKWLYKTYEKKYEQGSADRYYRLSMDLKDSLFTSEKNSNIVLMDFREKMRQEEIEAKKRKEAAERKESIEYSLIALSIILFAGSFLLLTRRFIINAKVIKAFGVIALLIVFEFFNLLLHPLLEKLTDHSPVFMLVALVGLAALLAPLHHKAEKWATVRLVDKNNEIRLASAKKPMYPSQNNQIIN